MRAITGTVLGFHTIGELKELIAAKDFDIAKVQETANAALPAWTQTNANEAAAWSLDWAAFLARYNVARSGAQLSITAAMLNGTPNALIPAETEWKAILKALTPTPGVLTPDSFQGLVVRLQAHIAHLISFEGQPQPTGTDADLAAFQATDATLRALPPVPGLNADPLSTSTKVLLGAGLVLGTVLLIKLK